jgi:hypothetical protein
VTAIKVPGRKADNSALAQVIKTKQQRWFGLFEQVPGVF